MLESKTSPTRKEVIRMLTWRVQVLTRGVTFTQDITARKPLTAVNRVLRDIDLKVGYRELAVITVELKGGEPWP